MASMKPVDVFNALTPKEKRQVLASIQTSPCDVRGHRYKPLKTKKFLFEFLDYTVFVCTACGKKMKA